MGTTDLYSRQQTKQRASLSSSVQAQTCSASARPLHHVPSNHIRLVCLKGEAALTAEESCCRRTFAALCHFKQQVPVLCVLGCLFLYMQSSQFFFSPPHPPLYVLVLPWVVEIVYLHVEELYVQKRFCLALSTCRKLDPDWQTSTATCSLNWFGPFTS